eukprot:6472993-Karenia_brevis.AAC.1
MFLPCFFYVSSTLLLCGTGPGPAWAQFKNSLPGPCQCPYVPRSVDCFDWPVTHAWQQKIP